METAFWSTYVESRHARACQCGRALRPAGHWQSLPSDVQTVFDNIPAKGRKLFWIEGTTRRFDGYNYFSEKPQSMLDWFNTRIDQESA